MMRIYDVKIRFEYPVPAHTDEEGIEHDAEIQDMFGQFQVGETDFSRALVAALDHMDRSMDENDVWEVLSVSLVENMGIVNWPGDENVPCNCPICRANDCPVEDLLIFDCIHCKEEVHLAEGNWQEVQCPNCGVLIGHDQIISVGKGKFIMVAVKKKDEGNFDEDIE